MEKVSWNTVNKKQIGLELIENGKETGEELVEIPSNTIIINIAR